MPSHRQDHKQDGRAQESSSSAESDQGNEDEQGDRQSSLKVRISFNQNRTTQMRFNSSVQVNNHMAHLQSTRSIPPPLTYHPVTASNDGWNRQVPPDSLPSPATSLPQRDRPFQCRECGRAFYDGSRLRTHLKIHSGDLPYECGLCFKSFISKYRLDRHQLIHSGTRAFRCEVCGHTFVTKDKLNRHHVIHTGERLNCDQCDKTFSRRDKLTRHRSTAHASKAS